MKDEIKEILDKLNNKAEHYILYDYEVKLLLNYITNLEQKVNKMMSTLKEEVSYLMPYEIYHNEVDNIVEKVEKIVNGGE